MKKFKGLIWISAIVMLFSIIAIGSGESSTNNEPKAKETPSRILSEADIEAYAGTYVGEDGCVLVLSGDGKAFYYSRSDELTETNLDWYVEDEKLTWHSVQLNCDIYADELLNEGNAVKFASTSFNWKDEIYKKVSNEYETPSIEDCKKLIATVYPDALGAGSPEKTNENQVQIPKCSEALEKMTYDYAQELFANAGFTNVSAEGKGDLIIAILHSEGDIDKITVDGKQTVLTEGLWLDKETPILISVHSKEKWGPTKAPGTQGEPIQTSGQEQPAATEAPKPTRAPATSAPITAAPTAKPTQAPTAAPTATPKPTQAPTAAPAAEMKCEPGKFYANMRKDSLFTYLTVSLPLKNTGTVNLYPGDLGFDLVGANGELIDKIQTYEVNFVPEVLRPGETGYYFADVILDCDASLVKNIKVSSGYKIERARCNCIRMDVSNVTYSDEPYFGVRVLGYVTNNTAKSESLVNVMALMFDSQGNLIDHTWTFLDGTISPGQTSSFEISGVTSNVKASQVAKCIVYAYPSQLNIGW